MSKTMYSRLERVEAMKLFVQDSVNIKRSAMEPNAMIHNNTNLSIYQKI